jgi:hypothetical protein
VSESSETRYYVRRFQRILWHVQAALWFSLVVLQLSLAREIRPFLAIQIAVSIIAAAGSAWLAIATWPPLVRVSDSTISWRFGGTLRWREVALGDVAGLRSPDSLDFRLVSRSGAEHRFPLLSLDPADRARVLSTLAPLVHGEERLPAPERASGMA